MILSRKSSWIRLKPAARCRIAMLIICIAANCKAYSTAFTTPIGDTLTKQITLDSVKKLVPRGYYVLNEQGARLSIKTKIDADYWQAKWKIADEQLASRNGDLLLVTLERNQWRDKSTRDTVAIKLLSRRILWANIWKYTAVASTAILAGKLILKP